jgi:hypothetical protein
MKRCLHSWGSIVTLLLPVAVSATTIVVGPSRQYKTLQQVTGLLLPGDTVLVDGDAVYTGGVVFSRPGTAQQRIVIRGVRINGIRPVIDGGTNGVTFMTASPNAADHYTLEGFDVRNASFRGIYHQADDLILRDVVIHGCNNGLMGADNGSGSLLLEYTEIYGCGSGTQAHQIYMATDEQAHPGSIFRMQFCWVHDGTGGNNVKSRAERNEIYYSWIEGAVYHELELIGPDPAGGVPAGLKREDSDVVGNVLWKKTTPSGGQANFYVTRLGGDGTGESKGRYRFVNNTIVMGSSAAFRLFDGLESVEMHNNVFIHPGGGAAPIFRSVEAVWTAGEVIAGQNNWVQAGLTTIPSQWTGTLGGTDPGFNNLSGGDVTPGNASPLIDAGTSAPQSPPGYPFASPLFPPVFLPPQQILLAPGTAQARQVIGVIDIGAYERVPLVSLSPDEPAPSKLRLEQNYPNPFNPTTVIACQWPVASDVKLVVFDLVGREVATLANGKYPGGRYEFKFNASNLTSGVYLCRLLARPEAAGGTAEIARTQKMLLVR